MPQEVWNQRRADQFTRIKARLTARGTDAGLAEEIAMRVVNRERARHGESTHATSGVKSIR